MMSLDNSGRGTGDLTGVSHVAVTTDGIATSIIQLTPLLKDTDTMAWVRMASDSL